MSTAPIFILSLPRAGSTLLQRILNSHSEISTQPEPWIALSIFYALKDEGVNSVYSHKPLVKAVTGFADSFPNGKSDYFASASDFLNNLYALASEPGSRYFVDKTPRYHLIVDELLRAYPNGKFIFLWRNPLAITASMIQTWGKGKWNLYMFLVDLYSGIESLVKAYESNKERTISVKYEDLVLSPDQQITKIMSYLDLSNDMDLQEVFSEKNRVDAPGRGDPVGQLKYNNVSKGSMDSWKSVMSNPLRKSWSKNYLEWIGQERLKVMGYDLQELYQIIDSQNINIEYLMSDITRYVYGKIYCNFQLDCIRNNEPWKNGLHFPQN